MTGTGAEGTELGGILRLTWVTDHLSHVLDHSQSDEPSGTWTGLACPDHGLEIGADVDNATLQRLAQGDLADFVWEAPADFTTEHGQLILNQARMFETTPVIKLGDHFKKIQQFQKRFKKIPKILELDHLTVTGDVYFGRNVTLRGTVIGMYLVRHNGA